jgi:hypothetical protein
VRTLARWTTAVTGSAAVFAGSWYACQDLAGLDSGTSGLIASAALVLTLAVLAWWAAREPASPAAQVSDPATATATGNRSQAVTRNTGFISGDIHNSTINFTGGHDRPPAAAPPREAGVRPEAAGDGPQPIKPDKRIFVGPGVTYEYLFALYDGKMDVQAQAAADLYIGKWMPISRPLSNVTPWNGTFSLVTVTLETEHTLQIRSVFLWIRDRSQFDRISVLTPGDLVTLHGRISKISSRQIDLEDGELVEHQEREGTSTPALAPAESPANVEEAIELGKRGAGTQPPDRIFVDRKPRELVGLFKRETSVQAQKQAEAFYGKWLKVSGPLGDVGAWTGNFSQVTFAYKTFFDVTVFMMFCDCAYVENRLSVLRKGDRITVQGQIERIDPISVQLTSCELVNS